MSVRDAWIGNSLFKDESLILSKPFITSSLPSERNEYGKCIHLSELNINNAVIMRTLVPENVQKVIVENICANRTAYLIDEYDEVDTFYFDEVDVKDVELIKSRSSSGEALMNKSKSNSWDAKELIFGGGNSINSLRNRVGSWEEHSNNSKKITERRCLKKAMVSF